jgi:pimeloyl-ACP methyl ester carboxylesterase
MVMTKKRVGLLLVLLLLVVSGCSLGLKDIPVAELEGQYMPPPSRWLTIDGLRVHYRDEGSGPPLLLLHGVLSSLHTWDGWAERLRDRYRVIRLDIPGFGLTGPANFAYARDNYIAFFKQFAEALSLERFAIAGNSLGGYFAWNYALAYPDQVKRLILLDPAAYPRELSLPLRLISNPVTGTIASWITPRWVTRLFIASAYGDENRVTDEVVDRYHRLLLREGNRAAARSIFAYVKTMRQQEPEGIPTLQPPVLLLWGERDTWIPVAESRRWKADLPGLTLIVYKGVGHIPMEEIPEQSAADAARFLEGALSGNP